MSAEEEFITQVEAEFLCEARDDLALFEILVGSLRSRAARPDEGLQFLRSELRKLLVLGTSVNQPLIGLLVRRLDNYLTDLTDPTDAQIDDIDSFVLVMRSVLDGEINREVDEAEFVRSLPVRRPADIKDLVHLDFEFLVVDPNRTSARIVGRELENCGYRVTAAHRSFDALELSVRTRPDLVISSAVLDEMSGVDLACALAAIPATESIPFALLTSFDFGHESLKRLPQGAALLRKGAGFGEDLAQTLDRFQIT